MASRFVVFFAACMMLVVPAVGAVAGSAAAAPDGLVCELLSHPEKAVITDAMPELGWVVNSSMKNDCQSAYQILVGSDAVKLKSDIADMWDSGVVKSSRSGSITYAGKALDSYGSYYWKVRTWDSNGAVGPYSAVQFFHTGKLVGGHSVSCYRLEKELRAPLKLKKKSAGHYFIDFGKAAFGTVQVTVTCDEPGKVMEVHLGEVAGVDFSVDRAPGETRRYRKLVLVLQEGEHTYTVKVVPPAGNRNVKGAAILMPEYVGEVMPFRYCELLNCPSELSGEMVQQVVVNYPFDESNSYFYSSSEMLNDVWELCKYSIKATSFAGYYVDGDRERIPYEADAYINQLCHYCVDKEYSIGRRTHEYLIVHPTWPTEWQLHSVLMAWADYMYTGDSESLEHYYDDLKAKTLIALGREDGLISTKTGLMTDEFLASIHINRKLNDIVDWPHGGGFGLKKNAGEVDGFVFKPINTVVNAFHYRAVILMSRMAEALGKDKDVCYFADAGKKVKAAFNGKLFNREKGIYVDGEGAEHSSLHANMFALAFGLVADENIETVTEFIKSRGMACSVYGAQYLLEALYAVDADDYALWLMSNTETDRSWPHMIYGVGSTITLEAWDNKYKPNQDWNHAWGAAPANIIPRFVMGVEPLEPGFSKIQIKPHPGSLEYARCKVPTIKGAVEVSFSGGKGKPFNMAVNIPANTSAKVYVPRGGTDTKLIVDGLAVKGCIEQNYFVLEEIGSGSHSFCAR